MAASAVLSYNPAVYSGLPQVNKAYESFKSFRDAVCNDLLSVALGHNVDGKYSAVLLHRHLELREDERIVETFRDGGSFSSPQLTATSPDAVPHTFKLIRDFNNNIQLLPLEFLAPGPSAHSLSEAIAELCDNQPFLRDYFDTLDRHGVAGAVGLTFQHRDVLRTADKPALKEHTEVPTRTSVVLPTAIEGIVGKAIPVIYHLDSNAKRPADECRWDGSGHETSVCMMHHVYCDGERH